MANTPQNKPCCDYSFFLFSKLHDLVVKSESEYDVLYGEQCNEYGKYCDSEFNDTDQPEYECILEYLYSITQQ